MTTEKDCLRREIAQFLKSRAPDRGLAFWNGKVAGFLPPREEVQECVVVYLSDGSLAQPDPTLAVLAVGVTDSGAVKIVINNDDYLYVRPSGDGHNPMEEIRRAFDALPCYTNE